MNASMRSESNFPSDRYRLITCMHYLAMQHYVWNTVAYSPSSSTAAEVTTRGEDAVLGDVTVVNLLVNPPSK